MQVCSRDEVYDRPDNAFAATVVGQMNALDCRITASADGFAQVDTPLGAFRAPNQKGLRTGKTAFFVIEQHGVECCDQW